MKRLLLVLLFAIVPAAVFAQVADRDVLITPDGTLYSVESVSDSSIQTEATRYLMLTIQRGTDKPVTMPVPDSLTPGAHWRPALAYDSESKTLFVFWLKMPNGMSSELRLASYSNGRWQPATSIDDQQYHLRFNLRIAVTRQVSTLQNDGSYTDQPALLVHAAWWEQTGYDEKARYALLTIQRGTVASIELHDLAEFATAPPMFPNEVDSKFNPEILRHPAFVDNGTQDSIDAIFGDVHINTFTRVTLKPIAEGRIHIPIGARPGGGRFGVPRAFSADWNGRISTITSPHDSDVLLYNTTKDAVSYITYSNGRWSGVQTLSLSDKLTADAAVAALSRMMSQ